MTSLAGARIHRLLGNSASLGPGVPYLGPKLLTLIHRSAWKRNSTKFAVASIRRRRGLRASGWGYAGFLSTIVDTLAASVARNRGKRAQVVAFQLPEKCCVRVHHPQNTRRYGQPPAAVPCLSGRGYAELRFSGVLRSLSIGRAAAPYNE